MYEKGCQFCVSKWIYWYPGMHFLSVWESFFCVGGFLTLCEGGLQILANCWATDPSSGQGRWQSFSNFLFMLFSFFALCFSSPFFPLFPPRCTYDSLVSAHNRKTSFCRFSLSSSSTYLSTPMHLLKPISFSPAWLRSLSTPQLLQSATILFSRVSRQYRNVCKLLLGCFYRHLLLVWLSNLLLFLF